MIFDGILCESWISFTMDQKILDTDQIEKQHKYIAL